MTVTDDISVPPAAPVAGGQDLRDVVVRGMRTEADGVVSLELVAYDGQPLPSWTPGAHVDLVLPSGLVRQYSLCGDPADRSSYRIGVLREQDGRGGSAELHDGAALGQRLQIRGPRNHFDLEADHEDYLFIAGGIGVTPLLAMARQTAAEGRPFTIVYGGRNLDSMAFRTELAQIAGERLVLVPQDTDGLIDLNGQLTQATQGTGIYCCGPSALLDAVTATCDAGGLTDNLRIERFSAGEAAGPPPEATTGEGFEVELRQTGCVLTVGPDDLLIDVVREKCPQVMSSCEEGFCGTCETRVLGGEPEHHDTILTEKDRAANKTMMICVGRSKSPRLVLDL